MGAVLCYAKKNHPRFFTTLKNSFSVTTYVNYEFYGSKMFISARSIKITWLKFLTLSIYHSIYQWKIEKILLQHFLRFYSKIYRFSKFHISVTTYANYKFYGSKMFISARSIKITWLMSIYHSIYQWKIEKFRCFSSKT